MWHRFSAIIRGRKMEPGPSKSCRSPWTPDHTRRECPLKATIQTLVPLLALVLPGVLSAQDSLAQNQTPDLPRDLITVEAARSRACVGGLARLSAFDSALAPYAQRVDRLNQLGRAVSLEKSGDAAPFDRADSLESAVAEWFQSDSALAVRFLEASDSTIPARRDEARNAMLNRLRQAIQGISAEAQQELGDGADIGKAAEPCVGAILARSVILDECETISSPVCEAAQATDSQDPQYRFVEAPEDVWDVEEYSPWSTPEPLQADANGDLVGASTSARARRGNAVFILTLKPLLLARSEVTDEEAAQYKANLDSLGFTFDHPGFVMAPGLEIQGNLPPPLGGETDYVLHFGNLTGDDAIWGMKAGQGGSFQATFLATGPMLARLQAGELVSLSALRVPEEEGASAQAVFSLPLLQVSQSNSVGTLLQYMGGGDLNRDLKTLIPPGSGG